MRIILLLVLLAGPGLVAAETVVSCKGHIDALPAVISTSGTWCLDHDVGTGIGSGAAIDITANNVTLDCNGFKIGGLAAGPATATIGIRSIDTLNTVVRNCNIRGFQFGIGFTGGGGRLVERNRIEGSTLAGVLMQGDGSVVRDNQIVDTGGPSATAIGVFTQGNIDVVDNIISGVRPVPGVSAIARGIQVALGYGVLARNIVRGVASGGGQTAAIFINSSAGRVAMRDNELMNRDSETTAYGIRCDGGESPAVLTGNSILLFPSPYAGCVDGGRNVQILP